MVGTVTDVDVQDSEDGTQYVMTVKQKTAYEISRSDWSSDVCSSDLNGAEANSHPFGCTGNW